MAIDRELLKRIIEGALLAAGAPLTRDKLHLLLIDPEIEESELPTKDDVQITLEEIQADTQGRGFELKEVSSGWRFQVIEETAPWVNRLWDEKPQKYSRAMLETLSLIAYRQPITRGDIEEIRGVAVSSYIIKTLVEREWIKVVGHRDVPGRPSLFATTRTFLDYFNVKSLDELPSLGEISDLDGLNAELDLEVEQALGVAPLAEGDAPTSEAQSDAFDDVDDETVEGEEVEAGNDEALGQQCEQDGNEELIEDALKTQDESSFNEDSEASEQAPNQDDTEENPESAIEPQDSNALDSDHEADEEDSQTTFKSGSSTASSIFD